MIIKKIAVGNSKEAYIESKLTKNLNIISSDDNNKGKTIIMQSLMYCLGSDPIFPSSFNFKNYYYITEFEFNNIEYLISRKNNTFVLQVENSLLMFDNASELKRYWTKNIFPLPEIIKDGTLRIADLDLFNDLFFVSQDKKDSTNISKKGFYTKKDFYNVIYSFMGLGDKSLNEEEIQLEKIKLKKLKEDKKIILRKNKLLNSKENHGTYLSRHSDRTAFQRKIKEIEQIRETLVYAKNERSRTLSRRVKYENTLKELKSLNINISTGKLICLDCNSSHISYVTTGKDSFAFDVTTQEVRYQIIESITEKIDSYTEEIEKQNVEINKCQQQLQKLLSEEDISLENLLLYKEETLGIDELETNLESLEREISEIHDSIKQSEASSEETIEKQNLLMKEILHVMNTVYAKIDPNGNLVFEDIFTKKSQVFSGSESTEFHLAKMYAFAEILKHPYPIVIDSFRAEDLATNRESVVIDLFNKLDNQIIFTTTLKEEEIGKYDAVSNIHHIDYSNHTPSKILKKKYVNEFAALIEKLMINIFN